MAKVLRFQLQVEEEARTLLQEDHGRWQKIFRAKTAIAQHDMARLSFHLGYGPTGECWVICAGDLQHVFVQVVWCHCL